MRGWIAERSPTRDPKLPSRQEWECLVDLAAANAINWFGIKFSTRHISVNFDCIKLIFILKCSWGFSAFNKLSRLANLYGKLLLNNKQRLYHYEMRNTHKYSYKCLNKCRAGYKEFLLQNLNFLHQKLEIISDEKNWNYAKNCLIAQ